MHEMLLLMSWLWGFPRLGFVNHRPSLVFICRNYKHKTQSNFLLSISSNIIVYWLIKVLLVILMNLDIILGSHYVKWFLPIDFIEQEIMVRHGFSHEIFLCILLRILCTALSSWSWVLRRRSFANNSFRWRRQGRSLEPCLRHCCTTIKIFNRDSIFGWF